MAEFVQYVVDDGPVRLIALDSTVPGQHAGHLCERRLQWLEARLDEAPTRPTMLFVHHPPFTLGESALNEMSREGRDGLGAVVARHPQIERVAIGHLHAKIERRFHGTLAVTCPSTSHQLSFDPTAPHRFTTTLDGAGCLLHVWGASTGLLTYGSHVPATSAAERTAGELAVKA
jgi:3',5'-cyclic AMP phosphodiesterase CpdA